MKFTIQTKGRSDFINITPKIEEIVREASVKDGAVLVFARHTTAALAIIEDESGAKEDLKDFLEKLVPENSEYQHHLKMEQPLNGAAHIKGGVIKPDLLIPIEDGKMCLGVWQQIFLIDFDAIPREREIVVKVSPAFL